jgi:hypothetical protein
VPAAPLLVFKAANALARKAPFVVPPVSDFSPAPAAQGKATIAFLVLILILLLTLYRYT